MSVNERVLPNGNIFYWPNIPFTKQFATFTWPSSVYLADWICQHPELWQGKCLLELGGGCTGMPAIAASAYARKVYWHDLKENAEAMQKQLALNCCSNVELIHFDWSCQPIAMPNADKIGILIAADVLYNKKDFGDVLFCIRSFNVEAAYLVYEERSPNYCIQPYLDLFHLKCSLLKRWQDFYLLLIESKAAKQRLIKSS